MKKLPISVFLIFFSFLAYSQKTGDDAEAYFYKGYAKYNLGDHYGAIQDYNKAIEINPDVAEAYLNRGSAKYNLGDKKGACLDWSKAGELGYYEAYKSIKQFCN